MQSRRAGPLPAQIADADAMAQPSFGAIHRSRRRTRSYRLSPGSGFYARIVPVYSGSFTSSQHLQNVAVIIDESFLSEIKLRRYSSANGQPHSVLPEIMGLHTNPIAPMLRESLSYGS